MAALNRDGVLNAIPLVAPTQYVLIQLLILFFINKLDMVMSLLVSPDCYIILVMPMLYTINFWIKFSRLLPLIPTVTA
jgi:hypothetical protein